MKYYSDITKKLYDDKESCIAEEEQVIKAQEEKEAKSKKLKEERAERAKAIEEAYKIANEKYAEADKLLEAFLQDYNCYYSTQTSVQPRFSNVIDTLFNLMF
jgi:regulator of protease activity HflC (stomatin/prohibitin superfamily)